MRKVLFGSALLLLVAMAAYFRFHHAKPPMEVAYGGNRQVTVWSTMAQVREPVTTIGFGERVDVLKRFQDEVQVQTAGGVTGWIQERDLLSADLWLKSKDLATRAAAMPIEARGHTRALANLHAEPGRDSPRIRQLNKDVPVDVLERSVVEAASARTPGAAEETSGPPGKKEDWWLVRAHTTDQTAMAGWVMGRFIDLDVPEPLPDYASSAAMRVVAWFELNGVIDDAGKTRPQYLLLGTHGPEGQPCDFSMLRVYTWGEKRARYETAFVESGVCGKLPVLVTRSPGTGGDVAFVFKNLSGNGAEQRTYRMKQTVVRRVREAGEKPAPKPKARKGAR
jgi:hypothetical protein